MKGSQISMDPINNGVIEIGPHGFWKYRRAPTESLIRAAHIFNSLNGKVIVEIGSGLQGAMSGNSILVWSQQTRAQQIYALDLESKHIEDVKKATKNYSRVTALVEDGMQFLANFVGIIDLLYLDFWTPDPEDRPIGTGRSDAYLVAYQNSRNKLADNAMILIDDTDHIHPWKHTRIVPAAREDGFHEIWQGRQTLLVRQHNNS